MQANHYYSAYGEVQSIWSLKGIPQANMWDAYRYNAEDYDDQTGLSYLRARYLSNDTASFMTVDLYLGNIAEPLSLNLYMYVQGNPVRWVDPSGRTKCDPKCKYTQDDYIKGILMLQMPKRLLGKLSFEDISITRDGFLVSAKTLEKIIVVVDSEWFGNPAGDMVEWITKIKPIDVYNGLGYYEDPLDTVRVWKEKLPSDWDTYEYATVMYEHEMHGMVLYNVGRTYKGGKNTVVAVLPLLLFEPKKHEGTPVAIMHSHPKPEPGYHNDFPSLEDVFLLGLVPWMEVGYVVPNDPCIDDTEIIAYGKITNNESFYHKGIDQPWYQEKLEAFKKAPLRYLFRLDE